VNTLLPVQGWPLLSNGRHAAALREEVAGEADVLHVLEGSFGDVLADLLVILLGTVGQHRAAVRDQLHVPDFLGGNARDDVVKGPQLRLGPEAEALEHGVVQRAHLTVLAAQEFLQRGGGVWVLLLGLRQLGPEQVPAARGCAGPHRAACYGRREPRQHEPMPVTPLTEVASPAGSPNSAKPMRADRDVRHAG
jgi:hypothetical protein